jgi:hypothetical protein
MDGKGLKMYLKLSLVLRLRKNRNSKKLLTPEVGVSFTSQARFDDIDDSRE